jgi:hypothetical protein
MSKTIRFGDLVRGSGRPEVVTLWVEPDKDRSFSKAVRENRVLTIHDDPKGHRKEFGQIGFHQEQGAIYLVFPKPLPDATESRIVGINYQLTEERPPAGPLAPKPHLQLAGRRKAARPAHVPKMELKTFDVLIRRTATIEDTHQVKAINEETAREAALKGVRRKRFNPARAVMREEILDVTNSR